MSEAIFGLISLGLCSSFVDLQNRGLTAPSRVLRTTHGVGRIDGQDLADHHPVEQHPQSGQPLLDGRFGVEF